MDSAVELETAALYDPYYEIDNAICGTLFNPQMASYIVRMMSLEVDTGRAQGGIFNKTTWPRIKSKFNRYFKVDYSIEQVTAKYRRLKKDYQTFNYLIRHTGFGWNDDLKVPTAPDETWERVERIRKNCMRFKTHTLPHYDILHKIFGGNFATGAYACNSTQPPRTDEAEAQIEQGPQPQTVQQGDEVLFQDDMSTSTQNTVTDKGKSSASGPSNASRVKKKGMSDVYDTALQAISENSAWRGEKDRAITRVYDAIFPFTTPSSATSDPEEILDVLLWLKDTNGIDSVTFANACANLEGLYHRLMFGGHG